MNEDLLQQLIIDTVKTHPGKKFRRRELYNYLKIKKLNYGEFKLMLDRLEQSGELERMKGRKYVTPDKGGILSGVFYASRSGGGSVRLPDGEKVIIRRGGINSAMSGDTVQVKILRKKGFGSSQMAEVLKIVERSKQPLIGVFKQFGNTSFVVPQGDRFTRNLFVNDSHGLDIKDGDLVVCTVEIPSTVHSHPVCSITEVLGDPDAPGVDVLALARRYELPVAFPGEVIGESERVSADLTPDIIAQRRDIRDTVTFTIDPEDAKDFDDAISISHLSGGRFELGVHIADVSHYVTPESAMDREARERGMSCYLVDRVIPMLPERLSNDLCSLKPGEDRLTKSIFVLIDGTGTVVKREIANTVINSSMRLTYQQVQAWLDSDRSDGGGDIPPGVGESLRVLSDLTDILIERRNERGSIDLEIPEAKVILDDRNRPVDIVKRGRLKSHRMVEEAMLIANIVTAETLAGIHAPFLYRIHDRPDEKAMETYSEIVHSLGYNFNPAKSQDQRYIQQFLTSLSDTAHEQTLNMLLLRSMKKAGYSPRNIGHFGLGLETYSHFTSPIRRYPDIIVHRQLDRYTGTRKENLPDHELVYYESLGEHLTRREIVIDSAERDSIRMKTAEFMRQYVGEEFTGTITGIIPIGMFVELDQFFVEGLIHVSNLDDDYYEIDRTGIMMVGRRTGKRYTIGDRLNVIVLSAVKERGEVNFMPVAPVRRRKK